MTNGRFAVYRNVFALIVEISDYEGETHLQTKHATYKEMRAWGKPFPPGQWRLFIRGMASSCPTPEKAGDIPCSSFKQVSRQELVCP